MSAPTDILGVILAGGQSRRLGGGDKGLTDIGGQTILARVIACLRPQVGTLALNANGDPERFSSLDVEFIPDIEFAGRGPLSGVLASLDWARRRNPDCAALVTVPSDVPFLPSDLVSRLSAARRHAIAVATSGGRRHPTIALWPIRVRDGIAEALARGDFGVDTLAAKLNAVEVAFAMRDIDRVPVDPFFNVNTTDDLATARVLAAKLKERQEQ